jgi:type I restriction enzyme S subunit
MLKYRIKNFCKLIDGFSFKSSFYRDRGIKVLRISNVSKGKIINKEPRYYPLELFEDYKNSILEEADILVTLTGDVGQVGIIKKEHLPAAVNQRVVGLRNESNDLLTEYLFYNLNNETFEEYCKINSQGTAQLNLSILKMLNYKISIPNIEVQQAIANFLDNKTTKIDELINLQEKAMERLVVFMESLIRKYFGSYVSHKEDFPNEDYYLKYKRIDSVCNIIRGNSAFTKNDLKNVGKYIGLQYGKTYKIDIVDDSFGYYVSEVFFKESQICTQGDTVIISTSETMEDLGHSCFYNIDNLGLLGGEQMMLKPNTDIINEKFLYYTSIVFTKELRRHATGLKVFRFNTEHVKNIFFNLPSIEEQKEIVRILDEKIPEIKELIQIKKDKIQKLNEYKKSLIYEAVTGKIEVM